jgi:hypothetical protein
VGLFFHDKPSDLHLEFQALTTNLGADVGKRIYRSPVIGGWLVLHHATMGTSMVFLPDSNHEWGGSSVNEANGEQ